MRPLLLLVFAIPTLSALGCAVHSDATGTTAGAEVSRPDLWAGSVSSTIERYTNDPCDNGQYRLDQNAIDYSEFARERAAVRNICFEVWKPGVTDTDDPNFWQQLDVEVHWRYVGTSAWKQAYVSSIDRRGNNRRYAWALDSSMDPFNDGGTVAAVPAPFDVVSETDQSVLADASVELFFTVNGEKLENSAGSPFAIKYEGQLRKATLQVPAGGAVLHPDVVCQGLKLGNGAGYIAADVTDAQAIAELGKGLDGSYIYAPQIGSNGTDLALTFGSIVNDTAPGELPHYVDGYYSAVSSAEAKDAGGGKMTLSIKAYSRASKQVETLSWTFDGCGRASQ